MDKQKLISFFFDFTGMDLDKLLEGLGIDEKLERQKIQNAVNDFEKYILERHGENPSYEGIAKFWKENQVSEELIKIRYNLNSKYKDYEEFKTFALDLAKPHYIFEGDVLDLLRVNRESQGIVELNPWDDFDIKMTLAMILGEREIV